MAFYPEEAPVPTYFAADAYFIVPLHSYSDYLNSGDNYSEFQVIDAYFEAYYNFDPGRIVDGDDYMEWQYRKKRHQQGKAFSLVVLENKTNQILGGVTVRSAALVHKSVFANGIGTDSTDNSEAAVSFWVLKSKQVEGLDRELLHSLCHWFEQEWSFSKVYFELEYFNDRERQIQIFTEAGLELKFADHGNNSVYGDETA